MDNEDDVTEAQATPSAVQQPGITVRWRPIRFAVLTASLLILLMLAFAGGVLVQTCRPDLGHTWFPAIVPPTPGANHVTSGPLPGSERSEETRAEEFLGQVAAHSRYLLERKTALDREAREQKIAYNVLRSRGCSADSEECTRLVARQKQTGAELTGVDAALKEAERLELLLNRLIDSQTTSPSALNPGLRLEIRRFLARCTPADAPMQVIPDEQWHGGPDSLMRLDAQRAPTRR